MKIAIVTTRSLLSEFKESHQSVSSNLLELLSTLGLYPIVLSNNEFGLSDLIELLDPSLIVLSGGENFGDNATRDEFEFGLLEIAENKSIPVIGICRGMQIMCIYGGGTIKNIDGHVGVSHKINQIHTDQMVPVNSFHNNGIDFLPEIFKVNCKAEDDSIESFSHITLPWLGIMWHPERENGMNSNDIFIKFMNNL
jgi:gamma-glutamyl-gamma-aminobutyrate hydrolase PuuD